MLMRCATGMVAGPVGMAAGLVFATGIATGVALGAGLAGAALVGRRMWEERQGWRSGNSTADDPLPPLDPMPDAPTA
jgi:hypothetical protein